LTIRVSTIIPAYNCALSIAQAIDSALGQDFDGQEVIVVDDGSSDATPVILEGYGDRIRMIQQANAGAASARNAGAAIARGQYLAFLDADDTWLPNTLGARYEALAANRKAVLAYGDFSIVDDMHMPLLNSVFLANLRGAKAPTMKDLLENTWPILPSAAIVRSDAFHDVGGFDEGFKEAAWEDCHLWLLVRERGPFVVVPQLLTAHVDHPQLLPEKYLPGRKRFLYLVRARYGSKAAGLCRNVNQYFASKFFERAVGRLHGGELVASARDLILAMRYSPGYVARNLKPARRLRKMARR
jgi:glycosyltransferase involved in cell wall biosynthesis